MHGSLHCRRRDHRRFILLFAVFLSSGVRAAAQTAAPHIVPVAAQSAPFGTTTRSVSVSLLASSFALPEDPGKSPLLFAGTYERYPSLANFSPIVEVRTLFLTQSSLPIVDLWGGRLRLEGFTSRLHMQNAQFGASAAGGLRYFRPPRLGYQSGPRSVGLSGISLSFHFGRDGQIGRPDQIWHRFGRIVRAPH